MRNARPRGQIFPPLPHFRMLTKNTRVILKYPFTYLICEADSRSDIQYLPVHPVQFLSTQYLYVATDTSREPDKSNSHLLLRSAV
jgi:hypothetical protein